LCPIHPHVGDSALRWKAADRSNLVVWDEYNEDAYETAKELQKHRFEWTKLLFHATQIDVVADQSEQDAHYVRAGASVWSEVEVAPRRAALSVNLVQEFVCLDAVRMAVRATPDHAGREQRHQDGHG
jgi:hypothetical protein